MTDGISSPRRHASPRGIIVTAIALGLLAVAIAVTSAATGVRLFAIQTPSMGETAPVGSLVFTHQGAPYGVGDIITFSIDGRTVTHRIVAETADALTTKGDLNGSPDGWSLDPDAVVGRVVAIVPGAGFVLTAAPWVLLGAVITEAVTRLRRAGAAWRGSVRLIGWAVTITAVALWIRPWFNVRLLDYRPSSDGDGVLMHVVNTGLLPILAGSTRLLSGQAASVLSTDRLENGAYTLAPVADPDWLVRLLLVAICLLPFLCGLIARPSDPVPLPTGLRSRPDRRAARIVVPAGLFTVVAVVVLVTVSTSTAAFSATIRNSADSAGTNPFFTCRGAETSIGKAATWAAFALSQGPHHEPDMSGNGRHGIWAVPNWPSGDVGCTRDTPATATVFSGSQCLYVPSWQNNPNVFALEAWFSTTTAPSGKIIGFGDGFLTPNDPNYWDRHIFLDDSGRVVFGLFSNGFVTLTSPPGTSYADGEWHSVIANLSAAGAQLFVDGVLVDANPSATTAQNYGGYWRIGCGRLTSWSSAPSTFTGRIQYAAIYRRPLTALEAQQHAAAGR